MLAWFIFCLSLVLSPYSLRSWKKVHFSDDGLLIPLIRYLANNLRYFIIAPHSISGSCLTYRPYEMWARACSNRFSGLCNSICYFICRSNKSHLPVQHVVWALLVSIDICRLVLNVLSVLCHACFEYSNYLVEPKHFRSLPV